VERIEIVRRRLGFSLIEMVTVIAVTSVLMAIAVGLLHTLFQFQQGGHERFRQRVTLDRLAQQFREDVHAASGLTTEGVGSLFHVGADVSEPSKPFAPDMKETPDPLLRGRKKLPGWRLQLPGSRTIQYWVAGDALARSEREGDKPVAWESFSLPPGAKVEMRVLEDRKPALASLRIAAGAEPSASAPPPVLLVEGVLGLDHRFAAPAAGTSKPSEGKPTEVKK